MAITRRERNENFFLWKPVEVGRSLFTKNAPLDLLYEIVEVTEPLCLEEVEAGGSDTSTTGGQESTLAAREILGMTPPNDELLERAKRFPPPPEWFEGDEERPF